MKRFKIMGVMLAAMWAIGLMAATSAFALPDISITQQLLPAASKLLKQHRKNEKSKAPVALCSAVKDGMCYI